MNDDMRSEAMSFMVSPLERELIERAARHEGLSLASASRRATLLWAKSQNAQASPVAAGSH